MIRSNGVMPTDLRHSELEYGGHTHTRNCMFFVRNIESGHFKCNSFDMNVFEVVHLKSLLQYQFLILLNIFAVLAVAACSCSLRVCMFVFRHRCENSSTFCCDCCSSSSCDCVHAVNVVSAQNATAGASGGCSLCYCCWRRCHFRRQCHSSIFPTAVAVEH